MSYGLNVLDETNCMTFANDGDNLISSSQVFINAFSRTPFH